MLYIFSKDDEFLTLLSKDTGLVDTWFKDYQNHLIDQPFVFEVSKNKSYEQSYDSEYNLTQVAGSFIGTINEVVTTKTVSPVEFVEEENQVAFYDRDGELRLVRIKELYEITTNNESQIRVICEPAYLELYDHFVEDRRVTNGTAQTALDRVLEGSRYVGEVTVDLGTATDNFYWIDGIESIFKILSTWGGALKDTVTLDENNKIIERKIWIVQRLGQDRGLIVEPDYNAEQIGRKTLSYIETALWAQGASLETDAGGYTRYITFEDVEWKVSNGDPVDKPKGQKWIGDPQALASDGYLHNGVRQHRFGHYKNLDIEEPEELLWATWQELQERKLKEITHESTIDVQDKEVSLGDTVTILNRDYDKPIELQSQITGLEYDPTDDEKDIKIVVGKFIDMSRDPLQDQIDELEQTVNDNRGRWEHPQIDDSSFPDIEPGKPSNVTATGAFQTIQLFWSYDSSVYVANYEVYGSQVADFVPDEQHLLYRGKVSSFNHEVESDQTWYYYVRAVNTRGTKSDFSNRVSASSVRITTPDILFGSVTSDLLADNLDLANKLSQGTIDAINEDPMNAIQEAENRILEDVSDRIGNVMNDISTIDEEIEDLLDRTSGIEGTVTNIVEDVNELEGSVSTTIEQLTNVEDVVGQHTSTLEQHYDWIHARVTDTEFNTVTGELRNDITDVDIKADGISADVSGLRSDLDSTDYNLSQLTIDVNGINTTVQETVTQVNDLTGEVSHHSTQISTISQKADSIEQTVINVEGDLDNAWSEISTVRQESNNLSFSISEVQANLTDWGVGNRNLFAIDSLLGDGLVYITNFGDPIELENDENTRNINQVAGAFVGTMTVSNQLYIKTHGDTGSLSGGSMLSITFWDDNKDSIENLSISNVEQGADQSVDIPSNAKYVSLGIVGSNSKGSIREAKIKVEEGRTASPWSPAPEDQARLSKAISFINLSPEGVRIHGEKVHITGQTLIDEGVIGTAAIADLAVERFHLNHGIIENVHIAEATIEHTRIKSLNVDDVIAGQMSLDYLKAGTIDTDKFIVRGGSSLDYAMIDGSFVELRGRYNRTWQGSTTTHDVKTRLQHGHLRFRNDNLDRSLYMSEFGISTYVDGEGERGGSSGTISWWDKSYSPSDSNGITVHSHGGVAALASNTSHVILDSYQSAQVLSKNSGVLINPYDDLTQRHFWFTKSTDGLNGYLVFGIEERTGLRFDGGSDGIVQVVDADFRTGGSTEIEAGVGRFNRITRRSGNQYIDIINDTYFQVGRDSANDRRITSQAIYQRTYSSGSNVHITDEYSLGRSTSARKYKRDIEPITKEYAYNFFDNVTPIFYRPQNTHDENMDHSHYGYIADDVAPVEPRLVQFGKNGEPESFNYDRSPTLLHVVLKNEVNRINTHETMINTLEEMSQNHEDRINLLELENQYLKQKVKQLEEKVA